MRRLNPRPIPLDEAAIHEDAAAVVRAIHDVALEEARVRRSDKVSLDWGMSASRHPAFRIELSAQAITGDRRIEKTIAQGIVSPANEGDRRIILGGAAGIWKGTSERPVKPEGRVTVRVTNHYSPIELADLTKGDRSPAFDQVLRVLRHELTHLGDWEIDRGEGPTYASQEGNLESSLPDYYNDPLEVRAFAREIADDVTRFTFLNAYDLRPGDLFERALGSSEQWERMHWHLTEENQRKILKVAYRAVQDARGPAIERTRKIRAMRDRMKELAAEKRRGNPAETTGVVVRPVPPVGGQDAVAAFAGRKRVGQLLFGQYDDVCPIGEVHVEPGYRRRGVGQALLWEADRVCRRRYGRSLSSSGIVSEPLRMLFERLVAEGRARWDERLGWRGEYVLIGQQRRENPVSLGDVARQRVLATHRDSEADASIGHPFFPKETVVRQWSETRAVGAEVEPVFVTVTTMPAPGGRAGRVLLSYDKGAAVSYGGIYFLGEHDRTCVQSVYLVPAYRGMGFGAWLADIARGLGVACVFGPVSDDGRRWAERNGLTLVDGERRGNPTRRRSDLEQKLLDRRAAFAIAAQHVLDDWEQDDDGVCEELGTGGVCDQIAAAITTVIVGTLTGVETMDGGQEGDDHAYIIAYDDDEAFLVDIPPGVYEVGGGYCWKKRKGVVLTEDDVVVERVNRADLGLEEREENPVVPAPPLGRGRAARVIAQAKASHGEQWEHHVEPLLWPAERLYLLTRARAEQKHWIDVLIEEQGPRRNPLPLLAAFAAVPVTPVIAAGAAARKRGHEAPR